MLSRQTKPELTLVRPLGPESDSRNETLVDDRRSFAPDVTVDANGAAWVVWVQPDCDRGEQILVRRFDGESPGARLVVGTESGIELQPCIVTLAHGSIRVFWVAYRNDTWQLMTRSFRGRDFGSEVVVASNDEGLFNPRAAIDASGTCWVVCERVAGGLTTIVAYRQAKDAWVEAEVGFAGAAPGRCRPEVALGPGAALWVGCEEYADEGKSRIVIRAIPETVRVAAADREAAEENTRQRTDGTTEPGSPAKAEGRMHETIAVSDVGLDAAHARLSPGDDGRLWVSWHSDGTPRLRCFDGTSLLEPDRLTDFTRLRYAANVETPRVRVAATADSESVFVVSSHADGARFRRCPVAASEREPTGFALREVADAPGRSDTPAETDVAGGTAAPPNPNRQRARRHKIETPDGTEYEVYFGLLQAATAGLEPMAGDRLFRRIRDGYGFDFAAASQPDGGSGGGLSGSELSVLWKATDLSNENDRFVSLHGYTWTGGGSEVVGGDGDGGANEGGIGHGVGGNGDSRVVLYPGSEAPLFDSSHADSSTEAKLFSRLRGMRALVIAAPDGGPTSPTDVVDDQIQRVIGVQVTESRDGSGSTAVDDSRRGARRDADLVAATALDRGQRLGFVGAGRAATAILASDLTRESIFQALYNRRCYATTGAPIFLDFRVNGRIAGSDVNYRTATPPRITLTVAGTGPIRSVEVVRSGRVLAGMQMQPGEGIAQLSFEFEDRSVAAGESHYYYARVLQEDGEAAWGGVIWVRVEDVG